MADVARAFQDHHREHAQSFAGLAGKAATGRRQPVAPHRVRPAVPVGRAPRPTSLAAAFAAGDGGGGHLHGRPGPAHRHRPGVAGGVDPADRGPPRRRARRGPRPRPSTTTAPCSRPTADAADDRAVPDRGEVSAMDPIERRRPSDGHVLPAPHPGRRRLLRGAGRRGRRVRPRQGRSRRCPQAGVAPTTTAIPEQNVDDVALLRTASSLEHSIIDAYTKVLATRRARRRRRPRSCAGSPTTTPRTPRYFEDPTRDIGGEPFTDGQRADADEHHRSGAARTSPTPATSRPTSSGSCTGSRPWPTGTLPVVRAAPAACRRCAARSCRSAAPRPATSAIAATLDPDRHGRAADADPGRPRRRRRHHHDGGGRHHHDDTGDPAHPRLPRCPGRSAR